jgi:hypothetical protein
MAITDYFDHRVLVYRYDAENPDRDEFNDIIPNWELLSAPAGLNGTLQRNPSGTMEDQGPGEIQIIPRHWFIHRDFDVKERDVLKVESGPNPHEVGRLYRVEEARPATGPVTIHHWEVLATIARPNILEEVPEVSS